MNKTIVYLLQIGAIAKHELPNDQWPELFQFLDQYIKSPQGSHREVSALDNKSGCLLDFRLVALLLCCICIDCKCTYIQLRICITNEKPMTFPPIFVCVLHVVNCHVPTGECRHNHR